MKIVQNHVVTKSVLSVVITLDEFEAGYLRSLMWKLVPTNVGFATELFHKLEHLELSKYDELYKDWRNNSRRQNGNSDSQ